MSKITIIGGGEIGRAIEKLLFNSQAEISIWDKDSMKNSSPKNLENIIPSADFIFLCIPSFAYQEVLGNIKSLLQFNTIIISLAKGIENSNRIIPEILEQDLPSQQPFGLLAGPMLAEEIVNNKKAFAVLATKNQDIFEKTKTLFENSNLQIVYSDDVRGVAIASVLKNIYSILFGVIDGLYLGNNVKGDILIKAFKEMKAIIGIFNGKIETIEGLAGLGDFFATATSEYSRNRQTGLDIVKTKVCCLSGEGAISFPSLRKILGDKIFQFPLLMTLGEIFEKPTEVENLIKKIN